MGLARHRRQIFQRGTFERGFVPQYLALALITPLSTLGLAIKLRLNDDKCLYNLKFSSKNNAVIASGTLLSRIMELSGHKVPQKIM